MNCETFETDTALAAALARIIVDDITRLPSIVLGLPTGRTPLALYRELVRVSRDESIDWSQVRTFNLDEFVGLGDGDEGSYHRFMDDRLFSHVNVRRQHIGFLNGRTTDIGAECARYDRAINDAGGLDLLVLGIGRNGHIGFNEPAAALRSRSHRVVLDEASRAANVQWFGGEIARVPREALTMGMGTILQARSIVLIATGESKHDAVRAMLDGGVTTRLPASFLQLHPRVTVMLDHAAAGGTVC